MTSSIPSPDLPPVVLRPPHDTDDDLLTVLASRDVSGEWDSFDDPVDELLSAESYGGGRMIVALPDGQAIGVVSWIQVPYGPNARSLAWNIGITILPEFRGRRLGAGAQRQLATYLFASSEANRVQADTDVANIPEQRSLSRAGFTREGVARQAQWRRGSWHDRVTYSILRSEAGDRSSLW